MKIHIWKTISLSMLCEDVIGVDGSEPRLISLKVSCPVDTPRNSPELTKTGAKKIFVIAS